MKFFCRLLHLVESGIVKYMLLENLPNAEICPQNLLTTERQLRNGDLLMTYQIMIAGFCTGGVVFFTEVGHNSRFYITITNELLIRFFFSQILFKYLMRWQQRTNIQPFKKKQKNNSNISSNNMLSSSPPPPYATLFNQSRNNNIWTTHNLPKSEVQKYINGRNYIVVKGQHGEERLIPMRTPSAALFQYSYTN